MGGLLLRLETVGYKKMKKTQISFKNLSKSVDREAGVWYYI